MQQLGADAVTLLRRSDGQGADDAGRLGHEGFALIGAEAGVNESDGFAVVDGNNEPGGIEVRFGEDVSFQNARVTERTAPRPVMESFQISTRLGGSVF